MFLRFRAARTLGAIGAWIKGLAIVIAELGAFAFVVYLAVHGRWGLAVLMLIVGMPVVMFVVDLATGLLLVAFLALAVLVGWRAPEPAVAWVDDDGYDEEDF